MPQSTGCSQVDKHATKLHLNRSIVAWIYLPSILSNKVLVSFVAKQQIDKQVLRTRTSHLFIIMAKTSPISSHGLLCSLLLLALKNSNAHLDGEQATGSPFVAVDYLIGTDFHDRIYRVERQFAPASMTTQMLQDLVHKGVPREGEEQIFPREAVKKIGDAGNLLNVEQYVAEDYASALRNFSKHEHHFRTENGEEAKHSLVYYIEQMEGPSYARAKDILSNVASPNILAGGGTVHLYMSSPGTAALANHTDVTDIVVLQLDGAKEWLLCSEKQPQQQAESRDQLPAPVLRTHETDFSRKLDTCSTYKATEIADHLDCERKTLYPGDALFLPRRVVHSARSLATTFSAHLTIGYSEASVCRDYEDYYNSNGMLHRGLCKTSCDDSCDKECDRGCDWYAISSCDISCDKCDTSCDSDFWCLT